MNLILTLLSFSFSFFFILLSYWKEDRIFNIIGSLSLMITAMLLITGIQITSLVPNLYVTNSNATGNYTVVSYSPQNYNYGVFYESLGIGVLFAIFAAIQYLYFSWSHKVVEESS